MREPQEMPERRRERANLGARLARFAARNTLIVGSVCVLLATALAVFALPRFAIDTHPATLVGIDPGLAARYAELRGSIPEPSDRVTAVVESPEPGRAKTAAARLASLLKERPDVFADVFAPGLGAFFDEHGLHYLQTADVERLVEQTESLVPLFQAIAVSPNLHGLAELVAQVARAVSQGRSPNGLDTLFAEAARAVQAEIAGQPQAIDWVSLAGGPAQYDPRSYVVDAALIGNFTRRGPFEASYAEFQRIAGQVQSEAGGALNIRIGDPPPGEGLDLGRAAALPALVAVVLIAVSLCFCVPQLRLALPVALFLIGATVILAAFVTVIAGPWTTATAAGFAIVMAFLAALLAITIWRYAVAIAFDLSPPQAIAMAGQRMAPVVAACATAVAIALLVFLHAYPSTTPPLMAALVASVFVSAALTMVFLPAFLASAPIDPERVEGHWLMHPPSDEEGGSWPTIRTICAVALMAAPLLAVPLLSMAGANLRTPNRASDTIHVLAPPGAPAQLLASRLAAIPGVAKVTWIESFLPVEETRNLEILARLRGLLPAVPENPLPDEAEVLRTDLDRLQEDLKTIANQAGVSPGLAKAAGELRRSLALFDAPQRAAPGAILRLQTRFFSRFGELLKKIDDLGRTAPLTLGDLDPEIRRRFVAPDGRWRIEVTPRPGAQPIDAVQSIVPAALSLELLDRSRDESMRWQAAVSAAAAIALFLVAGLIISRRLGAIVLIVVPLAVLSVALWALFAVTRLPLSPLNLIAPAVALILTATSAVSFAMRLREPEEDGWTGSTVLAATLCLGPSVALILSAVEDVASLGALLSAAILIHLLVSLVVTPQLGRWLAPGDALYFPESED